MKRVGPIEVESVDLSDLAANLPGDVEEIDVSGMQTVEEAAGDAIMAIGDVADSTDS